MKLGELLAVLSPGGSVLVAAAAFLTSPRVGRELVEDVLRGAGIGAVGGSATALIVWAADQLPERRMASMSVAERALKPLAILLAAAAALTLLGASALVIYAVALALLAAIGVYAIVLPVGIRRPLRPLPVRAAAPAASRPSPHPR